MLIPLSPRQLHEEMRRLLNDFLREPTKVLPQGLPGSHRTGKKIVSHVCENCSTQDQTVMTCRIDAMTLMKLCKPCANMVNTVQHGQHSSSSSSGDSSDGASVSTRSSQREGYARGTNLTTNLSGEIQASLRNLIRFISV